jgi:sugar phosphate isomerase/epimerase
LTKHILCAILVLTTLALGRKEKAMKLGVITDCFKKGTEGGIRAAAELGLSGVQIYATGGEFSPEALSEADIERYRAMLKECGLVVSALCGDMGGHGFEIAADNPARVEKTKKIIDLAVKFDSHVVTTHIGVIPDDPESERYKVMLSALSECGRYAAQCGVTMAIETGPEIAPVLHRFVTDAGEGVGVNLDPANFVMVTGQDPAEAVRLLGKKIVHTHLKDGVMLKKTAAEIIYGHFAEAGIEGLNVADYFLETPVGEGHVNWDEYFAALSEIGYDGFLTIERETGSDPKADIVLARDFVIAKGVLN